MFSNQMSQKLMFNNSLQRDFLANSGVDVAPGMAHIKTEESVADAIDTLLENNNNIKRLIFKIDNEVDQRGIAYIGLFVLPFSFFVIIKSKFPLDKEYIECINDSMSLNSNETLADKLAMNFRFVKPDAYSDFASYFSSFLKSGGVVEMAPPVDNQTDDLDEDETADSLVGLSDRCPSVHFFIEPDGDFKIIGSSDVVLTIWDII